MIPPIFRKDVPSEVVKCEPRDSRRVSHRHDPAVVVEVTVVDVTGGTDDNGVVVG